MLVTYRCAHCLRPLVVVDEMPEPCPDHPQGAVERHDVEG